MIIPTPQMMTIISHSEILKNEKSMMFTKKKDNARKKKYLKFICTENENSIDKTNRKIESKQI